MDPTLFPTDPHADPSPTHWARLAQVVITRGLDREDGLTYGITPEMGTLREGELVRVPLGRNNRRVEGVVVRITAPPETGKAPKHAIKGVAERLGSGFTPALLELGRWMARYYCCPLGMVLASMAPAAVRRGTGRIERIELEPSGAVPIKPIKGKTGETWKKIEALANSPQIGWPISPDALCDRIEEPTKSSVNRLIRMGLLREVRVISVRARAHETFEFDGPDAVELSPDQHNAVETLTSKLGSFHPALLFGVTGSGKTEVYLRVLASVLERGETGIVLVPEIGLTPQTVSRFVHRFGESEVAVLHSGLTSAQRNKEWTRIASGGARVVIGARSAIFAPLAQREDIGKLGLIIVDEEHDTSYKQDQLPRYHARDVAIKRAHLEGCPVILGSATPSLESWKNAQPGTGSYTLLRLPSRVGGGKLPKVEIVDLLIERQTQREYARAETGSSGSSWSFAIGPTLRRALRATLDRGAQAMLLLNRRGFANYCCCPDENCGWVLSCEQCDSAMVYHRSVRASGEDSFGKGLPKGYVRCHHCFAQQRLPSNCPQCSKIGRAHV